VLVIFGIGLIVFGIFSIRWYVRLSREPER